MIGREVKATRWDSSKAFKLLFVDQKFEPFDHRMQNKHAILNSDWSGSVY